MRAEFLRRAWCSARERTAALARSWKRRIGLGASALAIVAGLGFGLSSAGAQANIYVVQPGDNLSSIALRFYGNGALWPTIYNANAALIGADPNLVIVGTQLTIPNVVSAAQLTPVVPVAQVGQGVGVYTVLPGDVLNEIAFKVYGNHALWPAIYAANRNVIGPNPNIIKEGTVLTIPANPQVTVAQQTVLVQAQQQPQVQIVYVAVPVQQVQAQGQPQQAQQQPVLQPAPQGSGAIFLEPGRQIALPVGRGSQGEIAGLYTVRSGDTLTGISRAVYGSDQYWRAIYEANTDLIANPASLPVGVTLRIPR